MSAPTWRECHFCAYLELETNLVIRTSADPQDTLKPFHIQTSPWDLSPHVLQKNKAIANLQDQ